MNQNYDTGFSENRRSLLLFGQARHALQQILKHPGWYTPFRPTDLDEVNDIGQVLADSKVIQSLKEAIDLETPLTHLDPWRANKNIAIGHNELGLSYRLLNDFVPAEENIGMAIRILESYPSLNKELTFHLSRNLHDLAEVLYFRKRPAKAIFLLGRFRDMFVARPQTRFASLRNAISPTARRAKRESDALITLVARCKSCSLRHVERESEIPIDKPIHCPCYSDKPVAVTLLDDPVKHEIFASCQVIPYRDEASE